MMLDAMLVAGGNGFEFHMCTPAEQSEGAAALWQLEHCCGTTA